MNIKKITIEKQIANIFKVLGPSFRIELLYSIGYGEACVCHLVAILKKRQAYISQHLMVLRNAGLLETRREGKYIFYRIADNNIFTLIEAAAAIQNIQPGELTQVTDPEVYTDCACPSCEPEFVKETQTK